MFFLSRWKFLGKTARRHAREGKCHNSEMVWPMTLNFGKQLEDFHRKNDHLKKWVGTLTYEYQKPRFCHFWRLGMVWRQLGRLQSVQSYFSSNFYQVYTAIFSVASVHSDIFNGRNSIFYGIVHSDILSTWNGLLLAKNNAPLRTLACYNPNIPKNIRNYY